MGPATVSSLGSLNVIDCSVPNNRKKEKKYVKIYFCSNKAYIRIYAYENQYKNNDYSKSFDFINNYLIYYDLYIKKNNAKHIKIILFK